MTEKLYDVRWEDSREVLFVGTIDDCNNYREGMQILETTVLCRATPKEDVKFLCKLKKDSVSQIEQRYLETDEPSENFRKYLEAVQREYQVLIDWLKLYKGIK